MPTPEGHGAGAVVTQEERSCFVEAVRNGAIVPDATQVAYHFEGWLDKGQLIPHPDTNSTANGKWHDEGSTPL